MLEGSLMLASHSLLLLGVPLNRVLARIRAVREERYNLFRGFFHGATDAGGAADAAENLQPRLHSVLLTERSAAVGRRRGEIDFRGRIEIQSVRRRGALAEVPSADYLFETGDLLVLLGKPKDLAFAERLLLRG